MGHEETSPIIQIQLHSSFNPFIFIIVTEILSSNFHRNSIVRFKEAILDDKNESKEAEQKERGSSGTAGRFHMLYTDLSAVGGNLLNSGIL